MFLTSILLLVVSLNIVKIASVGPAFELNLTNGSVSDEFNNATTNSCQNFEKVEHGYVKILNSTLKTYAIVECFDGFVLDGAQTVFCINGRWEMTTPPKCNKFCFPPPNLKNGFYETENDQDDQEFYTKGTLATYSCMDGYDLMPPESKYRVCEKGIWTGADATCVAREKITGCSTPNDILDGYFVPEKPEEFDGFSIGQRLHYGCKSGFVLMGPSVQQCLEDGTWSPKIPPVCSMQVAEDSNEYGCPPAPKLPHSYNTIVQGAQSKSFAMPGTVVQIYCNSKYRNTRAPCQPGKLRCVNGEWVGIFPVCVPAHDCDPPPAVSFAVIYNSNPASYEISLTNNRYPIKSQIAYQCLPGYTLQGNEIFACSPGGCWLPVEPPTCVLHSTNSYFMKVNGINAVLISAGTGAGVLGLLLVICLITVCRRRKPLSRAVPIGPPVQRPDLGDHASLLHHPDRLALIAFADGVQNDQGALPTYDEATRDRAPSLASNRLHRPHWPNLGGRRSRNAPNPDIVHVTRHGSFASHTPSTRSAADSMGSTDTVAISEGSMNVTLDTASSQSGSQPASCRVHCGSLASFDTSSVVNTEGVPLLEESELEEIQGGDNVSIVLENPSISDSTSFKLSTNSADLN